LRYHCVFLPFTGMRKIDFSSFERANHTGRGMTLPVVLPLTDSSISLLFRSASRIPWSEAICYEPKSSSDINAYGNRLQIGPTQARQNTQGQPQPSSHLIPVSMLTLNTSCIPPLTVTVLGKAVAHPIQLHEGYNPATE